MKLRKAASALASCLLVAALPAFAQPVTPAAPQVAVQQITIANPGRAPMPVAIWAPALPSALPLVVISHGTGGGPAGHIDTARALAAAGFVVAAPMHPGDNFRDDSAVGKPEWLAGRSRDVTEVIDFMFGRWEGHARLAPGKVGIFGMSAGATTALISAGGTPQMSLVAKHCAVEPEFVCKIMKAENAAGAPAPQWVHDNRIAAAVVAAPGLGFAFAPSGLKDVRVPVQLWVGSDDATVPYETNGRLVRQQLGPSVDFHRVEGAVHLSFLAPCGSDSPPAICQDKPGFDRAAFHRDFNASLVAFFKTHLAAPAGKR